MNSPQHPTPSKLGATAYVVGGMSFIPLLGVLFGIVSIIWGLATPKAGGKRLAAIGAAGICFTILLYSALFYFGFKQRGGLYDDLRVTLAKSSINTLVPAIEYYRMQHSQYPESLKALQQSLPENTAISVFDPTAVKPGTKEPYFFYERVGTDHYYLRGLGPDGVPFTTDDIVPEISPADTNKVGLLLEKKSQ